MQIDSPTVQRVRDMLHTRAGLGTASQGARERIAQHESSPEVQALLERIAPICEALYLMMVADDDSDADEVASIRAPSSR